MRSCVTPHPPGDIAQRRNSPSACLPRSRCQRQICVGGGGVARLSPRSTINRQMRHVPPSSQIAKSPAFTANHVTQQHDVVTLAAC